MPSSFFQRHLFISLKVWIMKFFLFKYLFWTPSLPFAIWISVKLKVCQIQSAVSCHLDISAFTWCAEVFPLLFLATELFHRGLNFPRWGLHHLEFGRSNVTEHLGSLGLWVLMRKHTELHQAEAQVLGEKHLKELGRTALLQTWAMYQLEADG